MKQKFLLLNAAAALLLTTGCGTQNSSTWGQVGTAILTDVLTGGQGTSTVTNAGKTVTDVLSSVIGGLAKPTKQQLIGSWTYSQPGCAFTSDNLLAKAGGEIAASQIKQKLAPTYQSIGITASNTHVTFKEDGTFTAQFVGQNMSGNWTYDESTSKVTMKTLLLTLNCYAKRNANGIALLFESSKLLSLLQTVSAMSGSAEAQTVGSIAGSYDGLRLGFDFK